MKRLVPSLCLVVGLVVPSFGTAQEVGGGVIGGPALTNVAAEDDGFGDISGARVGYSFGLQGAYDFANILEVAPEVLFSRRGWTSDGAFEGADIDSDYGFSFLEIPLLVRLALPLGDVMAPKLFVGPHGGLFIDGSRDASSDELFIGDEADDIDSEDVHDLQFGLTVGAGVDFELPTAVFTTDIRYMRNLTSVFEESGEDDVFLQSWQVMVGVIF